MYVLGMPRTERLLSWCTFLGPAQLANDLDRWLGLLLTTTNRAWVARQLTMTILDNFCPKITTLILPVYPIILIESLISFILIRVSMQCFLVKNLYDAFITSSKRRIMSDSMSDVSELSASTFDNFMNMRAWQFTLWKDPSHGKTLRLISLVRIIAVLLECLTI